jgi:myosin heavy subunit
MRAAKHTSNCVSYGDEGQHQAFEISTLRKQGLLLYIILGLISLGALGGFGAFYLVFQYRYAALLLLFEGRHISTLDAFQARQEQVSKEYQTCLAREEYQLVELAKARGRLEALGDLANNHRSLRDQHQQSRDHIVHLESIREDSLSRVHQLESDVGEREDQVNELRKEMEGNLHHENEKLSDQSEKVRGLMTRRTELMSQAMVLGNAKKELETKLVEKKDEMKILRRKEWDCRASYKKMERSHKMMERQTQQRQDFLCKEEYVGMSDVVVLHFAECHRTDLF